MTLLQSRVSLEDKAGAVPHLLVGQSRPVCRMHPMTLLQAGHLAGEQLPLLNRSGTPIPGDDPQILACSHEPEYVFAYYHPVIQKPRARTALLLLSSAEEPRRIGTAKQQ
jgi:hypothetical protein